MAYSPTVFQLTHLLQRVYDRLEQAQGLLATVGTATTIVDSALADNYQDDELNGYVAFVEYDAAGAGAAPEGKWAAVTDYVASTFTLTTATFTDAVGAGDRITIVPNTLFPINDVLRLCNSALKDLGDVANVDTSLTTAADQTEYTVPSGVHYSRIVDVQMQEFTGDSNDNQYRGIYYKVVPDSSVGGANATIEIAQPTSGRTLRIISVQPHANVRSYADPISLDIHPTLAVAACALACAKWKRDVWKEKIPDLEQEYAIALQQHPLKRYPRKLNGMPVWENDRVRRGRRHYPGDQTIYDR